MAGLVFNTLKNDLNDFSELFFVFFLLWLRHKTFFQCVVTRFTKTVEKCFKNDFNVSRTDRQSFLRIDLKGLISLSQKVGIWKLGM